MLLNHVQTILAKTTIKLFLIVLSNSFFNSFMKMKNEKWTVFCFPFFYENEKQMRVLKIQSKNFLNMIMVVKYLNFVFHIEVKTNLTIKFWISFFNLSKTWNGTLGTQIELYKKYKKKHVFLRKKEATEVINFGFSKPDKKNFHWF